MVRVVVPWTMGEDDVGLPVADEVGDLLSRFEIRHQLTVVDIEHFRLDAEHRVAGFDFRLATLGERASGL